jgi:competence protein ComEC
VLVRLALVLGLLVGVGVPPVVSFAAAQLKQDPQTITVYVTRTGQKYHRESCRYLSRSKIPMSFGRSRQAI